MAAYRSTARNDRVKALAGVAVVHAALAAIILSGLSVDTVTAAVERLKTFDISEEHPPPPVVEPPPPPRPDESSAPSDEAAPANIRSRPTPVVAPTPPIPLPIEQRITTAEVRGPEGTDRTAGAADVPGPGTGAGGQGSGFGGGGTGGTGTGRGSGFTPARIIRKIPDSQYRRISAGRIPQGSATATFRVNPDGRASNCRIVRSSGDSYVDGIVCEAITQHMRFSPARDPRGRPVAQDLTYTPRWWPD